MKERLLATLLMLVLSLSAPSGSAAQNDFQRLWRERDPSMVPRLPRLPFAPRPHLDAPFPVPAPRPNAFLSPQDVLAILSARHLTLIGELRRRGDYYVLDARGPRGEVVRLVVNGFSGVVEGVRVLTPQPDARPGRGDPKEGNAKADPRPPEPPR